MTDAGAIGDTLPGVLGLAAQLERGDTTSVIATEWFLARIAELNGELNAYLSVFEAQAIAQATASDARRRRGQRLSLLDGVPLALKDNIDVAGFVTTNGTGALRDNVASEHAFVSAQLINAGAVLLGKLNMDEAAMGATTNNPHYGACHNPLVPGDVPGGSSGGSGAAVAAGLCAAALGTDTLGSVRIPAAYCGIVGLLGSRGQVSRRGVCALSPSLDQVGVLARSVDDAGAVLASIAAYDRLDDQSLPGADAFAAGLRLDANDSAKPDDGIRIGVISHAPDCDGPDAALISARISAIALALQERGVTVTDMVPPPTGYTGLRRACLLVVEAEGFVACQSWLSGAGVSDALRAMLGYGARQPAQTIELARAELRAARGRWLALFDAFDLLLLPTAPQTSFPIGTPVPASQADFTTPASVAGLPAISLPVGFTAGQSAGGATHRRALSAQLVGAPQSDVALLRMAKFIEQLQE